jgi:hypothetical protein
VCALFSPRGKTPSLSQSRTSPAAPGRSEPRKAAAELTAEGDDQGSMRVALLADIRAAFAAKAVDRMTSEDLVAYLVGLDDRPWPAYRGGKPITEVQIARLLKPLPVSSGTIRLDDGRTAKAIGAHSTMCLRGISALKTSQRHNPRISTALELVSKRHTRMAVTFPNWLEPLVFPRLVTV